MEIENPQKEEAKRLAPLQVNNLIEYYRMERATSFEGEVIIPSTEFCLKCIIEIYEHIGNQPELVAEAKRRLA
jgi:hypothetical protein